MSKEKSCLITQNLIGAVEWYITAPNSIIKAERGGDGRTTWKERALQDLTNLVNRIPGEFPIEAKRGVEFEKAVYENANKDILPGSEQFKRVCQEVRGYQFYQKAGRILKIDDNMCYFYAKFDAIKQEGPDVYIKDIKTTQEYKQNKYISGCQHEIYCYVKQAVRFEYIIAEWGVYPKINAVYRETYIPSDRLEEIIVDKTRDCLSTLKDLDLWTAYREKYCLY